MRCYRNRKPRYEDHAAWRKRNLRRRNQRPLSEKWHCTYSCYFGASHFHDWNGTLSAFTKSRIKNKIKCHTGFHDHCSVWNDDRLCSFSNPGNRHVFCCKCWHRFSEEPMTGSRRLLLQQFWCLWNSRFISFTAAFSFLSVCSGHIPDSSGSWQCQKGEKAV